MANFPIRTDLALEAREFIEEANGEMRGIIVDSYKEANDTVQVTHVQITTKNGAKAMGKPIGSYITLEADNLIDADEDYHREVSLVVAKQLKSLLPDFEKEKSILVVGLGNRDVTADALGPEVVDHLNITRHMLKQFGHAAYSCEKVHQISSIVPGVMGKTGMETAEIIRGVVSSTEPDIIIVIDALAARSTRRLTRTIQISNTGISPGSGVGNHRNAINEEAMGIPVLAIGIPTVVDAATIVGDACEAWWHESLKEPGPFPEEVRKYFKDLKNMYVTTKEIDEIIECISYTVSEALNSALHGTL